jgi:hypothetical protein
LKVWQVVAKRPQETAILCCVKSQKRADLIFTGAEACTFRGFTQHRQTIS